MAELDTGRLAGAPATAQAPAEESRNPFRTARYRRWWAATILGGMGTGISIATVPLFVERRVAEAERGPYITAALLCQFLPLALFMLVGGVVADRVERRRIIVRVYAAAACVSLCYVLLSATDVRAVWPVFLLTALIGTADAFGQPARMSMAPQILPPAQLQNGIILGTVAFMAAFQFLGPTVGGLLVDGPGITAAFTAEVIFLAIGALISTTIGTDRPVPTGKTIVADLKEGVAYVRRSKVILGLLFMQLLPGLFFIGPFRATGVLMVQDVLDAPDRYVGLLSGGFGAGVLIGSFAMTARSFGRRGLVLVASSIPGGLIFIAYGLNESAGLALALMVLWGLSAAIFINLANPLLQQNTERAMLGRVMSISSLCFAIATPLGVLHAGIIMSTIGPQTAVVLSGAAIAVIGAISLVALRPVLRLN